jgi:hypothetical protein
MMAVSRSHHGANITIESIAANATTKAGSPLTLLPVLVSVSRSSEPVTVTLLMLTLASTLLKFTLFAGTFLIAACVTASR